jgi:hypothetical protein
MKDPELYRLLQELRKEIETTEHADAEEQALLRDLGAHIDQLLARSENEDVHPNTVQQLQDTLDTLEANHPTLTAMLSKLLTTLSNAGI